MGEKVSVVVAIIEENGRYLMTRRPDDGRQNSGEWEFPEGRVKSGETDKRALERDLLEKLGIVVEAESFFSSSSHIYENGLHVDIRAFNCRYVSWNIKMIDIIDYDYIFPGNMGLYKISIPDLVFVKKLQEEAI